VLDMVGGSSQLVFKPLPTDDRTPSVTAALP